MDKIGALAIARKFAELAVKEFNPTKIILFGSFIKGNWNQDSDIDIAIVVKKLEQDYLLTLNLLYKLRRKIDTIIEPVLFIEDKDPSGFLESIESYGEVLYEKE
jgi:uncharacterized protein